MTKYIINETFHGYEKINVDNIDAANQQDNLYIIIVDNKCDGDVASYYKFMNTALKKHNRIILISIADDNKCFKPLASLLMTFDNYDIYEVDSRESLSASYLKVLEEREPDYCEVQTYVGGDLTAFSDMSMILFGIESLVEEGNEKALKAFLEEHIISIENLTTSLNSMKKTCELFNSNELVNEVNSLKDKEKKLSKTVAERDESLKDIKHERDEHKVEAENLKRENEKLKEKTKELQEQTSSSGSTITSFKTTSTQLLKGNKTKIVLYFKEISYVRYTNTLVTVLFEYLERKGLKTKMLIYDTGSELYKLYDPLRVITGNEYITAKGNLINKIDKFVIAEPSQMIIEDVLTSDQAFDVVIIYDRMHTQNDVVEGNLVTKFYVINSKKDYDSLKAQLKINDVSFIITDTTNSLNLNKEFKVIGDRNFIDIPTIPEYAKHVRISSSFGFSRYIKQATSTTKEGIIDTIIKKSKINTLYNE